MYDGLYGRTVRKDLNVWRLRQQKCGTLITLFMEM